MFQKTPYEFALAKVLAQCKKNNYEFLSFCDKNGEDIKEWNGTFKVFLKLRCNNCGNIWHTTSYKRFLKGGRCQKCVIMERAKEKRLDEKQVIDKIKIICQEQNYIFHGFVNGKYENAQTYLDLECNKCGSRWATTNYHNFIYGCKCPICNSSNLETSIFNCLTKLKKQFVHNKRYKHIGNLQIDFLIGNIGIECQGKQHFKPNLYYGGEEGFKKQIERDIRKKQLCEEHGIKLYYVVDDLKDVDWSIPIYNSDNTFDIYTFQTQIINTLF